MSVVLTTFVVAALASFLVAMAIVATTRWHYPLSADLPTEGPQKLHLTAVPRIGGVALAAGLVMGIIAAKLGVAGTGLLPHGLIFLGALSIAFAFGLAEDLTRRVGPWTRLLATFAAALIAHVGAGLAVPRFDFAPLDLLLRAHWLVPPLLTLFCVGAVAHAYNLADGLNGLLAGLAVIACCILGNAAGAQGDTHSALVAAALGGAAIGYVALNFPRARVFAGDSGAYLLGTAIAFLGIMVVMRNPSISPWLAFVAVIYPFTDTTFAIVRRLAQGRGIMQPDAEHLHSLLARWLSRRGSLARRRAGCGIANPLASSMVLAAYVPFAVTAVQVARDTESLVILSFGFALTYCVTWVLLWRSVTAHEALLAEANAE